MQTTDKHRAMRAGRLVLLLLGSLITVLLCGCAGQPQARSGEDRSQQTLLRVGITTDAPPLAFRDKNGITGLEVEFARELATHSGRRLKLVELPWEEQIPALLAGKTDIIMSGMTITAARRYQVAFADPYMITGQVSLVRLPERHRFNDGLVSLLNPTIQVGTIAGTTGDLFIQQNKARGKRRQFARPELAVRALQEGEIDAFVYDLPINFHYAALYADQGLAPVVTPMTREQIAWAVRPNDDLLLQAANAYLAAIKTDGHLQALVVKWIPFYRYIYNQ